LGSLVLVKRRSLLPTHYWRRSRRGASRFHAFDFQTNARLCAVTCAPNVEDLGPVEGMIGAPLPPGATVCAQCVDRVATRLKAKETG
jgi:hypothetical protein